MPAFVRTVALVFLRTCFQIAAPLWLVTRLFGYQLHPGFIVAASLAVYAVQHGLSAAVHRYCLPYMHRHMPGWGKATRAPLYMPGDLVDYDAADMGDQETGRVVASYIGGVAQELGIKFLEGAPRDEYAYTVMMTEPAPDGGYDYPYVTVSESKLSAIHLVPLRDEDGRER